MDTVPDVPFGSLIHTCSLAGFGYTEMPPAVVGSEMETVPQLGS
jgi:hypothetical protein